MARDTTSVAPPAGHGMIRVMGFEGKVSAVAAPAETRLAIASRAADAARVHAVFTTDVLPVQAVRL